ncbi:MAG TPA: M1 family aminopeptidase [Terriglobia bacterium]|nr:M1 family aminopeptidase [Terriglobia bacterium]
MLFWICLIAGGPTVRAQQPSDAAISDSNQIFQELQDVSVDPSQIYALRDFRMTRDRVTFYFNRGFVGFLTKVQGEVTGAVFSGEGEVLLVPPNPVEKQSLARFTQSPILEEQFSSVYLRFTDQTAQALLSKARRPDPDDPEQPTGFAEQWNKLVPSLNTAHSMRILQEWLSARDHSYFFAQLSGLNLGTFQVTVDQHLPEAVQVAAVEPRNNRLFADIWCSFESLAQARKASPAATPARVRSYTLDTRIHSNNSLTARVVLQLESLSSADRMIVFALSRHLKVSDVKDGSGKSLVVFQNPALEESQVEARGSDWVAVVLAAPHALGQPYTLTFTYQGDVIADVGNGVFYVGEHDSWYPNLGLSDRAKYDLTFTYPGRLTLVATGKRVEESSAGGVTRSRWVSDGAVPVAGFNLGHYDERERRLGDVSIELYATQEAEAALEKRYLASQSPESVIVDQGPDGPVPVVIPRAVPPLAPAALLDHVADSAAEAVRYFQTLFGPFPYSRLAISQIPGDFGQGWPGLVYLPTLAFLPRAERTQLGVRHSADELQEQVSVAHEIAHQWWGNMVGWKTYHDQWLSEGFASYAAALELARGPDGSRKFRDLLAGYRKDLLARNKDGATVDSEGPIWLGQRLSNSLDPTGYDTIVYQKACWVLHMLRMLLRDPATGSDVRFFKMLRDFAAEYRDQDPSTEDFIRHAQKYMTMADDLDHNRSLDWFFNEWVYGTGIPTYRLRAATKRLRGGRWIVEGTIEQSGVPPGFEMLVPVAARYGKDRKVTLGRVVVGASGGRFRFIIAESPSSIAIESDNVLTTSR